jgi:hypothetical protein
VGSYLGTKTNMVLVLYGSWRNQIFGKPTSANTISIFFSGCFLDLPVGKKENKMAVTAYSVFYDYDFGPNYLRNVAIMNIGSVDPNFTGSRALAGPGCTTYYWIRKHLVHTSGNFITSRNRQKFAYNL